MKKGHAKNSGRNISCGDLHLVGVRLMGSCDHCLEQLARLHRAEHLSVRGEFAVPAFNADQPR